jgi:hypothetical protein
LPEVLRRVASNLPDGPARAAVNANLSDELGRPAPHLDLFDTFAAAAGARCSGGLGSTGRKIVYQRRRSWLRLCGRPEFRLRLTNHAIAAQPASNDALARQVSVPEPRAARSGASH